MSSRISGTNENVRTFGDGTRDFSSLSLYEAAVDVDTTATGTATTEVLEIYDDAVYDLTININSGTHDATYPLVFRAASGHENRWSKTSGVRFESTSATAAWATISDPFVYFQDIGVKTSFNFAGARTAIACQAPDLLFSNCFFYDNTNIGAGGTVTGMNLNAGSDDTSLINTCFLNCADTNLNIANFCTGITIYNCVFRDAGTVGIQGSAAGTATIVKNTIVDNAGTTGFGGTYDSNSEFNISSDATAPGTDAQASVSPTFVSATDCHLDAADTIAQGNGVDLSTDPDGRFSFDDDVDGDTRAAPWDAGGDHVVSALAVPDKVFIATGVVPTTDTTVDLVATGMTGMPQAAEFWISYATAEGTATAEAFISIGATDGTNQWSTAIKSKDSVGTSDTARGSGSATVGSLHVTTTNSNAFDGFIEFDSWIEGGVRLDIFGANPFSSAFIIKAILYQGFANVAVGSFASPTVVAGELDISLGFRPTVVKLNSVSTVSGADIATAKYTAGIAVDTNPIEHHHVSLIRDDNLATTASGLHYGTNVTYSFFSDAIALDANGEVSNFNSDGFGYTTNDDDDGAVDMYYLALDTGSHPVYLGTFTTPTTTGSDANTDVGFTPIYAQLITSRVQAVNNTVTDDQSSSFGISGFNVSQAAVMSSSDDDGETTTVTACLMDSDPVATLNADGTIECAATLESLDTTGFTLDWTAVPTTAQKWILFVIGEEAAQRLQTLLGVGL